MKQSESKMVRIVKPDGQAGLSKAQKLFNRLIKKIDEERKQLAAWQAAIPIFQNKYASDYDPLVQSFDELRGKFVQLMDKVYAEKGFSKSDKAKIKDIICTIASELIANDGDEDLKRIYNQYSEIDFDAQAEEEKDALKSMMEGILGVDLGDDIDLSSTEKMMAHVGEKMRQKSAQEEKAREDYEALRTRRKKSAKALAKEAKQEEEAKNISQSIREVYRKLASALHPDRERNSLEQDRKTALMQRVNVAYAKQDLLRLLELQLEVEQIDQTMINTIAEDRLKHYNKILTDQSVELQHEIGAVKFSFRMRFNIPPEDFLSPATLISDLQKNIKSIQRDIKHLKNDLVSFQEMKNIKSWLKTYRIQSNSFFDEDALWDIGLDPFFGFDQGKRR